MFRVPVGFAGVVDIYKNGKLLRNYNTLTDYGKQFLRTRRPFGSTQALLLGSGRQDDPSTAEYLSNRVTWGRTQGSSIRLLKETLETCTYEIAYTVTVPKGSAWTLRELGLGESPNAGASDKLISYLLVRNSSGELSEIPVAKEDELRIVYRLQITFPLELPKVNVPIGGGSGGSVGVQFKHVPKVPPTGSWWDAVAELRSGENLTGARATAYSGSTVPEKDANGSWKSWGYASSGALFGYTFNFDPPLTKTNTQTLRLTSLWDFQNVNAIEVP